MFIYFPVNEICGYTISLRKEKTSILFWRQIDVFQQGSGFISVNGFEDLMQILIKARRNCQFIIAKINCNHDKFFLNIIAQNRKV